MSGDELHRRLLRGEHHRQGQAAQGGGGMIYVVVTGWLVPLVLVLFHRKGVK